MSRKHRTLAGFASVANDSKNDINININNESNTGDVIDEILGGQEVKKVFVGSYLAPDIADVLDRIAAGKKGAKSAIVNEALRRLFQERGLM